MIEDIYEPLEKYRDEFRERFFRTATDTFEDFVLKSAIDIRANQKTVADINKNISRKDSLEFRRGIVYFFTVICWCVLLGSLGYGAYILCEDVNKQHLWGVIAALTVSVFLLFIICRRMKDLDSRIAELAKAIADLTATAWQQMAPLNDLFNWETLTGMVTKCVPHFVFDSFCNQSRISELEESFGWNNSFNNNRSVLFVHSGEIKGNPFVIVKFRHQEWGSKVYTGTKVISYTETVRDSNGKLRRETRYQTLVATVTKPVPEYIEDSMVIYGNDAVPDLSFSREPSAHSGKTGFFNDFFKKREQKKLEKFARNLTDDSDFTMMSNKEFEVLFHADDRNDEIGFRLMFTPMAQAQMVKLLNDTKISYGDDFTFVKRGKINIISPAHLQVDDIDVDPKQFKDYSFDNVKRFFISRSNKFFKSVYFSIAPLLTVPVYQQTRRRESIYSGEKDERVSFWETESFVNYIGDKKFEHPECITSNILKTTGSADQAGGVIRVTAHGFSGTERIDLIPVYGNDGRMHNVPVQWTEYNPVQQTAEITVGVADKETADADTASIRRRIYLVR